MLGYVSTVIEFMIYSHYLVQGLPDVMDPDLPGHFVSIEILLGLLHEDFLYFGDLSSVISLSLMTHLLCGD